MGGGLSPSPPPPSCIRPPTWDGRRSNAVIRRTTPQAVRETSGARRLARTTPCPSAPRTVQAVEHPQRLSGRESEGALHDADAALALIRLHDLVATAREIGERLAREGLHARRLPVGHRAPVGIRGHCPRPPRSVLAVPRCSRGRDRQRGRHRRGHPPRPSRHRRDPATHRCPAPLRRAPRDRSSAMRRPGDGHLGDPHA